MKNSKITIVFVILIFSVVYLYKVNIVKEEKVTFNTSRNFNLSLKKENCFATNSELMLLNATDDFISTLNIDEQTIFKVTYSGNEVKELDYICLEKHKSIGYYDLRNESSYLFNDMENAIYKFDSKGEVIIKYQPLFPVYSVMRLYDNVFIVSTSVNKTSNLEFLIVNIENEEVKRKIKSPLPQKRNGFWIYEGFFVKKGTDILYITYYSNDVIKFDKKGNVLLSFELIHDTPLIQLTENNDNLQIAKNPSESVLDAALDKNHLYILSNVNEIDKQKTKNYRFLDLYDLNNGKYIKSMVAPNYGSVGSVIPIELTIAKNKVIMLYGTSYCIYSKN